MTGADDRFRQSLLPVCLEGLRLNAIVVAAIELRLSGHLAQGPLTVPELAQKAGISERGCQAVADGMVALRLWRVKDRRYENTPTAQALLVEWAPAYVGNEHPDLFRAWLPLLGRITEVVRTGATPYEVDSPETLAFWAVLTPSMARRGIKTADLAVQLAGLSEGAPHILDIGGGAAGLYASAILTANPSAQVTQIDWPHINAGARERLAHAGLSRRFATIDGDYHSVDFGREVYDAAIASHVLHQETPGSNRLLMERTAAALTSGGRLIVSGWIVDDGRTGPAASLMFNTTALMLSPEGKAYERHEIQELLLASGFDAPKFTSAVDGVTLAVAQKRSG